jgi:type VI secretion system protein ImpK
MAGALDTVIVSPLIDQFWLFYSEIMRLKRAITDQQAAPGLPGVGAAPTMRPDEPPPGPAPAVPAQPALFDAGESAAQARQVAISLQRMLEHFAVQAMRQGGQFAQGIHNEALYVMAALADEVFLHEVDWPEKHAYRSVLVESLVFKSHVAGEQVFVNLDRLLELRDPNHAELATVYLLALSLGFRGKFRRVADHGRLAGYRRQLFRFIMHRPTSLDSETLRLCAACYDHTLREGGGLRLRPLRRWIMGLAALVAFLVVVSHVIWLVETADLQRALENVFAVAAETSR